MEKKKISAKIVADSIDPRGNRITTYVLTYPRFIHAELMTHRLFSRNAASSRAIPFNKLLKSVIDDPFIPIAFQKDHKGMQGTEYFIGDELNDAIIKWDTARFYATEEAAKLNNLGVSKQICNRLLEPFQWYTSLITATEYDNFFELRCPKIHHAADGKYYKSVKDWNDVDKDIYYEGLSCLHPENISQAEIHIQALAEAMWDAQNESKPKKLKAGEWHIPFGDRMPESFAPIKPEIRIKIATARAARLSYMTFEGVIDKQKDIALHDQLFESKHASPFEHCCRVLNEEEYNSLGKMILHPEKGYVFEKGWVDNIRGFISYRRILNI